MDYDKWISYKSGPFILNCNRIYIYIYILFILYVYNYIYIYIFMCYLEYIYIYIYIYFLKVSHLGTKNQENSK